ncbi:MAG: hypothetical protein M3071_19650 [Actinomycetota bacterium]|nr:hypothetical protein [Actinomycetota bacterium]
MAVIAVVLSVLALAPVAAADTFKVNDPTDAPLAAITGTSCVSTHGGTCTLRAAVQAANNTGGASTISLPASTYTLTIPPADYHSNPACTTMYEFGGDGCDSNDPAHGDLDVLSGTTLTISGAGSGSTTIDAHSVDRALTVQSGGGLSLSGLTIQGGHQAYGMFCFSTNSMAAYNCQPSSGVDNESVGGAIYSDGALSTTSDVVFRGNQANRPNFSNRGYGGAIYAGPDSTALSLSGAVFNADFAFRGSALYDQAPVVATISGSTFSQNDTAGGDGTIFGDWTGTATNPSLSITGSTFSNNLSGNGGAIYWSSPGDLTANGGNTFSGNSAAAGGVVYNNFYNHNTSLNGDVIKNNTAYVAAVIYQHDSSDVTGDSVTLNNDEVDGNHATYVGVGYFGAGAGPTSVSSSYVGNSGADGGVFYLADTSSFGQGSSLRNVTMSGNSSNYGGAMYVDSSAPNPLTMVNDTIAFNTASVVAGGIYGASYATPGAGGGVTNTIVSQNSGGDCAGVGGSQFTAAEDSGYNSDGDASCFGYTGHPSSDKVAVNPALSQAAVNGGPSQVQTDAEHAGGPTVDAGNNAACPANDARGLARPQTAADPCDIGAFELVSAGLSLANTAPSSATASQPFNETITAADPTAAGPSTGTTVVDQLPAGETLYAVTPSQGSCSSSGSPAKVTCALGLINPGSSAAVSLVVAEANAAVVTNTATVTNDEGSSASAAATTQVGTATAPPTVATVPVAVTGPAGGVGRTIAALAGVVNPGGQMTLYFFEFGPSRHYGEGTTVGRTGSVSQAVVAALAHLSPATTYHYRLIAFNDSGISYGTDATFKTQGTAPGKVLLDSRELAVRSGKVHVPLTCASDKRCSGRLSITTRLKLTTASRPETVECAVSSSRRYEIGTHMRHVMKVPLRATCVNALAMHGGELRVRVTVSPRSGQQGLVELATLLT